MIIINNRIIFKVIKMCNKNKIKIIFNLNRINIKIIKINKINFNKIQVSIKQVIIKIINKITIKTKTSQN